MFNDLDFKKIFPLMTFESGEEETCRKYMEKVRKISVLKKLRIVYLIYVATLHMTIITKNLMRDKRSKSFI